MSRPHASTAVHRLARGAGVAMIAWGWLCMACTPQRHRTPDDTLVMLIESAVRTVDPRYTLSNFDNKVSRLVVPGLTTVDTPTTEPALMLAESIQRVDDVTWEVTLRPGLRFSDGSPITAADVEYSFESMLAPKSDSVYHKTYREKYSKVEALDERRVRFHLVRPLSTFLTDLDQGILSKRAAGPDGHFGGKPPVGAGSYRLVELTDTHALLEANPYYPFDKAILPRLEIRFVRDSAARILMLVGGSADLLQNAVRLDLIDDVAARPRVEVDSGPSQILTFLLMNNDDKILANPRVRQAIAMALDRRSLIAAKFSGRAVLATGLLPPGSPFYEGDVTRWDYDPARAKRLLDEAGFPDPDGDGPASRFALSYKTSSDEFRKSVARVIAEQLRQVGIAVEVRSFEFATFFSDIKKGQYQLATMQSAEIGGPDYYFAYFHSSRIPSKADPDANNRWHYRNARVDELCQAGRDEPDAQKRRAIYAEVQRLVAADVPVVPLWHEDIVVLHNRDVSGYAIIASGRFGGLARVRKSR